MYYKLSFENDTETETKELNTSANCVEFEARKLFIEHDEKGKVVIERKSSEYYGDYKHWMTISSGPITKNNSKDLSDLFYGGNSSARWANELHPLKQYQLDQEDFSVRRLMWICQIKRRMLFGPMRTEYNNKRDKQVKIIKTKGTTYEEIVSIATKYECLNELVFE